MDKRYFSEKVAEWYGENKRNLPWRQTKDPYKIWLSEIILQQTRVNQGLPYYEKFVLRFPNVKSLAQADEQEVLRLWQGLGYYTRARNLHKCAKEVLSLYNGTFPKTYSQLIKLPGIGEYTAAAIASISNGEPVAVVDGNVFRVLSRVYGIDDDIASLQAKKKFSNLANSLICHASPDVHNQAVMEFGALWCTPKLPKCVDCPLQSFCVAYQKNLQHLLPVKAKSKKPKKRYFYYFVFRKGNTILMKKRAHKDIWHGLFDFFLVEKTKVTRPEKIIGEHTLLKKWTMKAKTIEVSPLYKHVLTHQIIQAKFVMISIPGNDIPNEKEGLKFFPAKKVNDLPKPVLISRFLEDYPI